MAKNITELPLDDRPYEKLERIGEKNLTNSELLAIIIKTGTPSLNCLDIAQNILNGNKHGTGLTDLDYLTTLSLQELKAYEGIGRVKSIQIKAVIELSKRVSDIYTLQKDKISSPKDVFGMLNAGFAGQKQELLKTILLNKQNKIISVITNSLGNGGGIKIGIKEILREPIKQMACSIIIVHNHPSGSLFPSRDDITFTKKVTEMAKLFDIDVLDHIIIANNNFVSLKEEKYF